MGHNDSTHGPYCLVHEYHTVSILSSWPLPPSTPPPLQPSPRSQQNGFPSVPSAQSARPPPIQPQQPRPSLGGLVEAHEQYFLCGCELSGAKDSYTFRLPESAVDEGHMLWFRSATLGLDAVEKERNVVEIRCLDREGKEQRLQLCALTLGRQETCKLDLAMTWTLDREVTLKLVKGSGPVSVVGTH